MRYALIGCGRIARNHMIAAHNTSLELVAMCDLHQGKMETLLGNSAFAGTAPRFYTDYKKMMDEVRPELVAIATDSGVHAEIALYCIRAGANVIIEKPIAMSMADAKLIAREAKRCGVKVAACHQNRFNLSCQQMHKAREEGRFGRLSHGSIHVRWNRNQNYYDQAAWRGRWASDGGALMNQCIHGIDLLLWMMGSRPVRVYGVTRQQYHPYLEAEDIGMAVVSFENGAVATIEGTVNVYPKNLEETLYLFGETGTVKLGGAATNNIDVWQFADQTEEDTGLEGRQEVIGNVYGNGHSRLYADMLEAIRDDREPLVNAEEGMHALEMVLAIYCSQKTGLVVTLPLEDFASTDMEGTFERKD